MVSLPHKNSNKLMSTITRWVVTIAFHDPLKLSSNEGETVIHIGPN